MICSFKYSYTGSMDNCSASSLKQQQVDMSLHSYKLSCFRANQYLLLLLNDACLAEKQLIPIL